MAEDTSDRLLQQQLERLTVSSTGAAGTAVTAGKRRLDSLDHKRDKGKKVTQEISPCQRLCQRPLTRAEVLNYVEILPGGFGLHFLSLREDLGTLTPVNIKTITSSTNLGADSPEEIADPVPLPTYPLTKSMSSEYYLLLYRMVENQIYLKNGITIGIDETSSLGDVDDDNVSVLIADWKLPVELMSFTTFLQSDSRLSDCIESTDTIRQRIISSYQESQSYPDLRSAYRILMSRNRSQYSRDVMRTQVQMVLKEYLSSIYTRYRQSTDVSTLFQTYSFFYLESRLLSLYPVARDFSICSYTFDAAGQVVAFPFPTRSDTEVAVAREEILGQLQSMRARIEEYYPLVGASIDSFI